METRELVEGALAALETDSAKQVIGYASRLLPPDVALGLALARNMVSPLYMLVRSFVDGQIDEAKFKDGWNKMLAEGAIADALVQAAALQRTEGA